MTMLSNESIRCGVCGHKSDQTVLRTCNTFYGCDLDGKQFEDDVLYTLLQECPKCHYVAEQISEPIARIDILSSPLYQKAIHVKEVSPLARKFLAAAVIVHEANPRMAAYHLLTAAWICEDCDLLAAAMSCRRDAAEYFEKSRRFETIEDIQAAFVEVDVLRRCSRFDEAESIRKKLEWKDEWLDDTQRNVLRYQRKLIGQEDSDKHQLPDDSDGTPE